MFGLGKRQLTLFSLILLFWSSLAWGQGQLVVAIPQDIQSFDPFVVNEVAGESIAKALFDNLLERTPKASYPLASPPATKS
ncbi:MAG: hypothetical protein R2880_16375 [Deinococcales bacterium]